MTEDEKRQYDAISDLYHRAWDQFNERRRHEFQVALAYWAALAGASAGSVQLSTLPDIPGGRYALVAFSATSVLLYLLWLRGIWRAHGTDQRIAIDYQRQMQKMAKAEFSPDLQAFLAERKGQMGRLSHPCGVFHIGLTLLLAVTLVLVNWSRFRSDDEKMGAPSTKTTTTLDSPPSAATNVPSL